MKNKIITIVSMQVLSHMIYLVSTKEVKFFIKFAGMGPLSPVPHILRSLGNPNVIFFQISTFESWNESLKQGKYLAKTRQTDARAGVGAFRNSVKEK